MQEKFEMVAKTLKGLEAVLADELRNLGAEDVKPGRRMVSFVGELEMLYKANLCCRTALRILKPFHKFVAKNADELYEQVKEYDWSTIMSLDQTFCIDPVVNSEEFQHSRFVTYKVKDAIVDWFRDRYGADKRPGVRLKDADIMINVHITDDDVTLSLDSSGESLHKRGYRVAQTEAPINEVLAAGIIMLSGWHGDTPFVDPMCGSGTFLIEAALIAANINPGIYRKSFAFENWPDFDRELFESLYNDDSNEREFGYKIYGADISPRAIAIARENIKSAGVGQYIELEVKPLSQWTEAPIPAGVMVTNPPYGERISVDDMDALYANIGTVLKNAFTGYQAWIIGYREEYFQKIGLAPSEKVALLNGNLDCELREYIIFDGNKKSFLASGGRLKEDKKRTDDHPRRRSDDDRPRRHFDDDDRPRRRFDDDDRPRRRSDDDRPRRKFDDEGGEYRREEKFKTRRRFDDDERPGKSSRDDRKGKYRDDRRKFGRDERKVSRKHDGDERRSFDGDDRRQKREDRGQSWYGKPKYTPETNTEITESENPLAKRRNMRYMESVIGKKPSLPPSEEPRMRSRGWKKK